MCSVAKVPVALVLANRGVYNGRLLPTIESVPEGEQGSVSPLIAPRHRALTPPARRLAQDRPEVTMPPDPAFDEFMSRLQAGDEQAAAAVYHRFVPTLIALIRGRLDPHLRAKVDPEDIVQSVFRTFFLRNADGRFHLGSWESLLSVLAVIAIRKCAQQAKYYRAARRNIRRETEVTPASDESGTAWEPPASEPLPPERAAMAEIVTELLQGLDASEQPILILSLKGSTATEISTEIGRTTRTVQRVLQRLRKRLERMAHEESAAR
jgi:RNA polymerase sigma-70 factor (ECF subfamily)